MSSPILSWLQSVFDSKTAVGVSLGAAASFLSKVLWDRYFIERTRTPEQLLERLEKNRLSDYGRRRLKEEAQTALTECKRRLSPPKTGEKINLPNEQNAVGQNRIIVRNVAMAYGDSACPYGEPSSTSTPLFIRLGEAKSLANGQTSIVSFQDQLNALVSELNGVFTGLNDSVKSSKRLFAEVLQDSVRPILWLSVLDIVLTNKNQVEKLLEQLAQVSRNWLPGISVFIEVYLPYDIACELANLVNPINQTEAGEIAYREGVAPRYAVARNKAVEILKEGLSLGRLVAPNEIYRIDENLLTTRLSKDFPESRRNLNLWTTIAISGPPGAGKTQTAHLLVEELRHDQHIIAMIVSSRDLITGLERILKEVTREGIYKSLIELFCDTKSEHLPQSIPAPLLHDTISIQGLKDALYTNLETGKQKAVLIVDELDYNRSVREALLRRIDNGIEGLGIRLILISRAEILPNQIQCQLWQIDEAKQILGRWCQEKGLQIGAEFQKGWLAEQSTFSIYLLHAIIENIGDLEGEPSALLRKAITAHVRYIAAELKPYLKRVEVSIEQVKTMLLDNKTKDEILAVLNSGVDRTDEEIEQEVVALFGVISWFSRFEEQDGFLDAEKILQWSRGILRTEEAAKKLLDKGEEVGIFSTSRTWRDVLVADGCAVLYLSSQRGELKTGTVAEMVQKLVDTDALSVLSLALDARILMEIILSVASAKPTLHKVVHELANNDFLARIKRDPALIQTFAEKLYSQGLRTDASHIAPIALTLAKLKGLYKKLDDHYPEMIHGSDEEARLALATMAALHLENPQYFVEVEQLGADTMLAANMAVWLWGEQGAYPLFRHLIHIYDPIRLGHNEVAVCKVWSDWFSWQQKSSILRAVERILKDYIPDAKHMDIYALLIETALRASMFQNHKLPEESIHRLEKAALYYTKNDKKKLANVIIKWVAYYVNPRLVNVNVDWEIDSTCEFALPHQANLALPVSDILFVELKNNDRFRLPSSKELCALVHIQINSPEFVRDNLPNPLPENRKFAPTTLTTWNGKHSDFIRAAQFNKPISWRPRFELRHEV